MLKGVADLHGHTFEFEECPIGGVAINQTGTPLPLPTLDACVTSNAVLLGAVGAPEHDKLVSELRPEAGLLALRAPLGATRMRPVVAYEPHECSSPLNRSLQTCLGASSRWSFIWSTGASLAAGPAALSTPCAIVTEIERIAHVAFSSLARRQKFFGDRPTF